jgi:hypothetical protein
MTYKNCYYPYLEKKVYGNQKFNRKTTQTDQAPPTKQKQIKQNTKQDRKKTVQKHKQAQEIPTTKARALIQSEEPLKDDSEEQEFISFLINLTLYSHCIQVDRIKKSLKITKG